MLLLLQPHDTCAVLPSAKVVCKPTPTVDVDPVVSGSTVCMQVHPLSTTRNQAAAMWIGCGLDASSTTVSSHYHLGADDRHEARLLFIAQSSTIFPLLSAAVWTEYGNARRFKKQSVTDRRARDAATRNGGSLVRCVYEQTVMPSPPPRRAPKKARRREWVLLSCHVM